MAQRGVNDVDDENNPVNSQIRIIKSQEYQCLKCTWIFNRFFNAMRHYERFHLPIKPIICKMCGKIFLVKWEYHVHRIRIHKIIKTYGRCIPLRGKNIVSSTGKYELAVKHRILDKWYVQGIQNASATQPIENIINPLRAGKKYHILNRWNEEKQQKVLQSIENDINNKIRSSKLETSNDASNILICSQLENTRRLYKYKVTSEKSLMKILSSKINF